MLINKFFKKIMKCISWLRTNRNDGYMLYLKAEHPMEYKRIREEENRYSRTFLR